MSKFASQILLLLLIAIGAQSVLADKIVLKNGDRLTGTILRKDADSITLQTDAMGAVKIKWTLVSEVVSDKPIAITLEDGKIVEGVVNTRGDRIEIEANGQKMEIDQKSVRGFRSKEEQGKFEAEQRRESDKGFFAFWSGTIDAGFSMTSGNADTRSFSGGFRAARETPKTKLSAYANALQVRNSSTGTVRITAQSVWSGARFDADINKTWFAFSSGDFEYNKPQKLDLRAVLGGGVGYHAIRKDTANLDFTFGATNNYENFSTGLTRNSAELLFGQDFKVKINKRARFNNRFVFYPNLTHVGDVRALLDASLQTDINSWLGWQVTIGNRYNSRPVTATEKNDFLMSTGLRVSFGKNRKR